MAEDLDEWMENAPDDAEGPDDVDGANPAPLRNGGNHAVAAAQLDAVADPAGEVTNHDQEDVTTMPLEEDPAGFLRAPAQRSISASGLLARRQATNSGTPDMNLMSGIDMPDQTGSSALHERPPEGLRAGTPTAADIIPGEGPLTPRNNAGPFVFDGSAGRADGLRLALSSGVSNID